MTMNNQRNPVNFFEWIAVARKDRNRLHLMLKNGDFEAAGFFLQQTLEK